MKKRLLSLLLCLVMALSLVPTTAFADNEIPITAIEATSSDFKPPVYGEANTYYHNCHFEVTNGAQVSIPVDLTKWIKYDENGGITIYEEPTFTEGTYRFMCDIRTNGTAYTFADETTFKVNGVSWTIIPGNHGTVIEYFNNNRTCYYTFAYSPFFVVEKSGTSITDLPITASWDASSRTISSYSAAQAGFTVSKVEMAKNGVAITQATPGDTINVAFTVQLDPGYVFDDNCHAYWNGQQNTAIIAGSTANVKRFVFKVTVPQVATYDYYIDGVQVTGGNKDDVLGDGTVTFFEKGEFDPNCNVILLEDLNISENSGLGYYKYDKDEMAAMYFGEDTIVILLGANSIFGDDAYDDIVTGDTCKLQIMGDGMLYVDVGTENTALYAPGGIVTVSERADVNLFGYEALDLSYTDENVVVKDNASLYCYAYQNNNGYDGTGLVGRGVEVYDNAEFTAESQYNGDAIFTWAEKYSSNDYDIKILKKGEYQNAQFSYDKKAHQPYLLQNGLNTNNGVSEGDCRYINMKAKHSSVMPGDVDGNGKVNMVDVTKLRQYLTNKTKYPLAVEAAADVDNSGKINMADVTKIRQYLTNKDKYPLG